MKILLYCILFAAFFVFYIRYLENTSVFYPERFIAATPADVQFAYEDVYLNTKDQIRLNGWYIPSKNSHTTILFFHGNAGNLGGRLGKIALFHQLGFNVFIIDYRGYGKSEGKPTEKGMYLDALAAYDYLAAREGFDQQICIAYGASLGGAAAVDLAIQRPLTGIILDSTFTSAPDMAKRIFPFIPSFLVQTKLDSYSKISQIRIPKLFLHSQEDETVPYELGRKLFEAASEPKTFLEITGGHNDNIVESEKVFIDGIQEFVKTLN